MKLDWVWERARHDFGSGYGHRLVLEYIVDRHYAVSVNTGHSVPLIAVVDDTTVEALRTVAERHATLVQDRAIPDEELRWIRVGGGGSQIGWAWHGVYNLSHRYTKGGVARFDVNYFPFDPRVGTVLLIGAPEVTLTQAKRLANNHDLKRMIEIEEGMSIRPFER